MNYVLLIKTLIEAIKTVENLMPASPGKDKFDVALAMVEGVMGDMSELAPKLLAVATTVVTGLRAAGVFAPKAVAKP